MLAPDEQRAVEAFRAAWSGAGMPSLASCHLDRVRVLHTTTATEFTRRCFPYKPEGAASCISQDNVPQGMRVVGLPVVVLRPGEPVDARGELEQVEPFFRDTTGSIGLRMAAARSAVAPSSARG